MAFKFKLQKVLEFRQQLEEQAMQALARARHACEQEKARLTELRGELENQRAVLKNSADLSGAERWLILSYCGALEQDIYNSQSRLHYLELAVTHSQQELVEKAQERKLLENLKERQERINTEQEKFNEQRQLDETATIRFRQTAI